MYSEHIHLEYIFIQAPEGNKLIYLKVYLLNCDIINL